MFWLGISIGFFAGPIVIVTLLWMLRDWLPPTLFMPSDWD
jgi:hypothetical protein